MHAHLVPGSVGRGSAPSVRPSWWPNLPANSGNYSNDTLRWFSKYMVQGHLLNHNVGGPGNTMDNLTPITKHANHDHLTMVEQHVKQAFATNGIVHYEVAPHYGGGYMVGIGERIVGSTLSGPQKNTVVNDINQYCAPHFAEYLHCEFDVYDIHGNVQQHNPLSWRITNKSS